MRLTLPLKEITIRPLRFKPDKIGLRYCREALKLTDEKKRMKEKHEKAR
ncbi:hypothetical protein ACFLW8_05230 [Chloroflexota bacterium]